MSDYDFALASLTRVRSNIEKGKGPVERAELLELVKALQTLANAVPRPVRSENDLDVFIRDFKTRKHGWV